MKPIEPHETLIMPEDDMHACTACGVRARGLVHLDLIFGFRRMGDVRHTVRVIPWCKKCRVAGARPIADPSNVDVATWERVREHYPGVAYVLGSLERDLVKIGYTEQHPLARLKQIATSCPDALELIGYWGGVMFSETLEHAALNDRRHRGEWFEMTRADAVDLVREHEGIVHDEVCEVANDNQQQDTGSQEQQLQLLLGEVAS